MKDIARSTVSKIWLALVALTIVSWAVGLEERGGGHHTLLVFTIMTITIVKIRMVGLYFMELRHAPIPLRSGFEGYCIVLFGLLSGLFFFI